MNNDQIKNKLRVRFWNKVNLYHGITDEDCWEWIGALSDSGYGRISVYGVNKIAHRISYRLNIGPLIRGMCICHTCDNPKCVNPSHLFQGYAYQNTHDMLAKGRENYGIRPTGTSHVNSKLTNDLVLKIKQATGTQREMSKQFGISQAVISNIRNNKAWKHIC